MTAFLRLAVGLGGLLFILIGLAFLIHPAQMGALFFLEAQGSQGLATIRADLTAFFVVGGLFAVLGAWRQDAQALNVPLLLLAIALFGRTVSLVVDGRGPEAIQPMLVEAVFIALIVAAQRAFARR
jgi:Domain of unknown function (DUF4345)